MFTVVFDAVLAGSPQLNNATKRSVESSSRHRLHSISATADIVLFGLIFSNNVYLPPVKRDQRF